MSSSPLEVLLRHMYGYWESAILAAALEHEVFGHIARGAATEQRLAEAASISSRGARALLDGLLAMGLIEVSEGGYSVAAVYEPYLMPDRRDYLGGYAELIRSTLGDWSDLSEVVATGRPRQKQEGVDPQNAFWSTLVRAVAPLTAATAVAAGRHLDVASKPEFRMLDVGGGSGAFCAQWLALNPNGHCTQLDWPNVNALAKDYVAASGCEARFETIDGDMERVDLAPGAYDYVVYANIAHGLSARRNQTMLRRTRTWLKERGTLVVAGLIPDVQRNGHPLALLSTSNLLLNSEEGTTHTLGDYESWLRDVGFEAIGFEVVPGLPFSIIYAS